MDQALFVVDAGGSGGQRRIACSLTIRDLDLKPGAGIGRSKWQKQPDRDGDVIPITEAARSLR